MRKFWGLTKRNMMVFFEDKQSVVFSLLTSIIVFVLYMLFLRRTFVDAIYSILDSAEGLKGFIETQDIDTYTSLLLFTGILGSAMITVPFHCLTILVKDRENGVDLDISASPIRRWQIVLSYFTASAISAILMTFVILTAGLVFLISTGSVYLNAGNVMASYGIVVLGSVSATAFFMIVVLFFRSSSSCGAFFGILSAAAGFVIGAYIPVSQFSEGIQTACNIFPASHITILLRNTLLSGVLGQMDQSIGGLDNGMFTDTLRETFSFTAHIFEQNLGVPAMICYVIVFTLACIAGMIFTYAKTYRRN